MAKQPQHDETIEGNMSKSNRLDVPLTNPHQAAFAIEFRDRAEHEQNRRDALAGRGSMFGTVDMSRDWCKEGAIRHIAAREGRPGGMTFRKGEMAIPEEK
jgi:hypothetical protein